MNASNPHILSVACILFWLWGVLLLLSAVAIGYPAMVTRSSIAPAALLVVWGVAYVIGGFALRRRIWGVRWWASALSGLSAVVLFIVQYKLSLLGVAVNVAALALIILSWRVLAPTSAAP
jgi:hypothetical protein